jgi:hypothetical protein
MHTLAEQDLVQIWEVGLRQHLLDRALTVLMAAFPGTSRDTLALLSIGQRDACLLAVRQQLFGPLLLGLTACPACSEQIEFSLNVAEMPIPSNISPAHSLQAMAIAHGTIQFRLPDSRDLAAIVGCRNTIAARSILARRCVVQYVQDGVVVPVENLPEMLISTLAAEIEQRDPLAEISINLQCSACEHRWQMPFDIVSFFWTEISALVKRVLRDIHTLARAYGWREADILAMGPVRRQLYLEMVMNG